MKICVIFYMQGSFGATKGRQEDREMQSCGNVIILFTWPFYSLLKYLLYMVFSELCFFETVAQLETIE